MYEKYDALIDKSRGCLLGGAVGDALGAPVEFKSRNEIIRSFGKKGIRDFALAYGRLGAITDDTQMTLFTAEGCLQNLLSGKDDPKSTLFESYQRWLWTQGEEGDTPCNRTGWLSEQRALFSRRAPGNTCLSALRKNGAEKNNSKGCGGIMRVAPCGIMHVGDPLKAFEMGLIAAKLTHGHYTGYLAAAVFAAIIAQLMNGTQLSEAIHNSRQLLLERAGHDETLAALDDAVRRAAINEAPTDAIPALGEGWIAEEALAISIYCALMATDLEDGIVTAVNITGDSDSTGAITGNLLGTIYGATQIPARWLEQLELRDVIEITAKDLAMPIRANTDFWLRYRMSR